MTNRRPIGIDLFAGVGGLSLGFEQAGFDVAAAVEIDPVHCAAHKFNFPDTAVIPHSVQNISGADIRKAAGIGERRVDCVFGGAPCQGFSLIGHRAIDDPRNSLVKDFVRIVSELDARSFVFENVKGLTVGKHKHFLAEVVAEFEAAGYQVVTPWKVLNAAHYGTPQSRERLILMGVKNGEKLPAYPAPSTNGAGKKKTFADLHFGPTCQDALDDLPDADQFAGLLSSDSIRASLRDNPSEYAAQMRCLSNDAWQLGRPRNWDPATLTSSARTGHTEISRRRFEETGEGKVEPVSRFFKLSRSGVSNTLRAGTDGARGAFTSPRPIHYEHPR
uniref:DNA cytosine methyltransferase n=1 Tax=Henriciella pelagia TaxID=1977912 RepID=UPI0035171AAA